MKTLNLFLFGEDSIDDVKTIRQTAIQSAANGFITEWTSDSVSVKKVVNLPTEQIIHECNVFLRLYDSCIRKVNPIITETRPNLSFS